MSKTIEAQLKDLILEKHKSIRAFAASIDVPYSTINNIFYRGFGSLSFNIAVRVCEALDIDMNNLQNNKLERLDSKAFSLIETIAAHHDTEDWSEEELRDIDNFKNYVLLKRKQHNS